MMDAISGYTLISTSNLFNFFIVCLDLINEDLRSHFIDNIKIHLGMWWHNSFKQYLSRKLPNSVHLKHFS